MIQLRATYDAILKEVREFDPPKDMFIPELGRLAKVVLIEDKLYVANSAEKHPVWYPVVPETLNTSAAPALRAPSANLANSLLNSPVSFLTPPPPYTAESVWPAPASPKADIKSVRPDTRDTAPGTDTRKTPHTDAKPITKKKKQSTKYVNSR
ncbi:MAG: hypothetical protein EOO38_28815 [Cytophagaceae bacterium]|nr:MAG: hypothetical protein EOO38_28815 [Cytophagaceae bacterium]